MLHWLVTSLLTLLCALVAGGQNTPPDVALALDRGSALPGETVAGRVTVTFAEGLHAYQNPPSEDYMIPLTVTATEGTALEGVEYPKGQAMAVGGSETPVLVYSGRTVVPIRIAAPREPGDHTVALDVRYQQCDARMCFPPRTVRVEAKLTVVASEPPVAPTVRILALAAAPAAPATGGTVTVTWAFEGSPRGTLDVGGEITTVPPAGSRRLTLERETKVALTVPVAGGRPVVRTLTLRPSRGEAEAAPGGPTGSGVPGDPRETPTDAEGGPESAVTDGGPPSTATGRAGSTDSAPVSGESAGQSATGLAGWLQSNFKSGNYLSIVLGAIFVGLALTLTPCVYPMIPVTVTYFGNQSAANRAGKLALGAMYTLGIAITYGIVGAVFAALGRGVGALFTYPWFLFGLSALMAVLALSMFDVYEIGVPPFLGRHLKGRSGPVGALVMGLLMGFAAAPCAGALVSAVAIEVANTRSLPIGMLVFTAIGVGLGLPFLALAAASTGANRALPRSGGWLKTVKAILGMVVLWLAVDYLFKGLGMKAGEPGTLLAWAVAYGLAAAYLLFFDRSEPSRVVLALKGSAVLVLGLLMGSALQERSTALFLRELSATGGGTLAGVAWIPYTDEAFEEAKASGKPILVDATADWCTSCKVIERNVFQSPRGIRALSGVVALKIDHSTGVDQGYIDATSKRFGIVGLPHIAFFRPGGEQVVVKNDLASVEELEAALRLAGASP